MLMYGAARFGLEFLRGDSSRGALGALSTSQWISLAAMVCGAVIWLWRRTLPMVELPLAKGERRGAETEAGEEPLATPRPRHKRKAPR